MTNRLFYGDNLDVLRGKIASGSVDLCYIDPPFNSKRNYFQIYTNQGGEDRAQAQAFVDTWTWDAAGVAEAGLAWLTDLDRLNPSPLTPHAAVLTPQTVALIRGLAEVLGKGSLLAYIVHMTQRIVEIHRVLKPTGSFYLHCDPTASHYLKLVCDAVFCGQGGDFLSEIVWKRTTSHSAAHRWGGVHDVILFYAKSMDYIWNEISLPHSAEYSGRYKNVDDRGRIWADDNLTAPGVRGGFSGEVWRGLTQLQEAFTGR